MRCSSPRGLFVPCLVCLSLWLGDFQPRATADDSAPVVEDHPSGVFSFSAKVSDEASPTTLIRCLADLSFPASRRT